MKSTRSKTPRTVEVLAVQYADETGVVLRDAQDAATATVFTPDAEVMLALKRSPRGKWMWDYSDHVPGCGPLWRARWDSVEAALAAVTARTAITFRTVEL